VLPSRLRTAALLGLLASTVVLGAPSPARAFSPYLVVPEPAVAEASPAYRYANMSDDEALAELDRRKILYSKVEGAFGVRAPVRLTGRLHGVNFHSSLPPDLRVRSPYEILDARLALALDDFAAVLERHEIDEVIHFSLYRPNVAKGEHVAEEEPVASLPSVRARASQVVVRAPAAARAPVAQAPAPAGAARAPAGKGAPPLERSVALGSKTLGGKGSLDASGKAGSAAAGRKQKGAPPGAEKAGAIVARAPGAAPKRGGAPSVLPAKGAGPASAALPGNAGKRVDAVAHREPVQSRQAWAPPGTRHPAGLAIDVGLVHKRDGRWLSVARHFHGRLGEKTCGEGAQIVDDPDAKELHALVCEATELGVFTYVLTPNYNAAHADHFHMEIKPGVRWFLTH
jgi:hypothetical protein